MRSIKNLVCIHIHLLPTWEQIHYINNDLWKFFKSVPRFQNISFDIFPYIFVIVSQSVFKQEIIYSKKDLMQSLTFKNFNSLARSKWTSKTKKKDYSRYIFEWSHKL